MTSPKTTSVQHREVRDGEKKTGMILEYQIDNNLHSDQDYGETFLQKCLFTDDKLIAFTGVTFAAFTTSCCLIDIYKRVVKTRVQIERPINQIDDYLMLCAK